MKRPFAIIGIPVFLVLSVLYKASGTAVAVTALVAAVLLGVSLLVKSLRQGKAVPAVLASVTAACLVLIGAGVFCLAMAAHHWDFSLLDSEKLF